MQMYYCCLSNTFVMQLPYPRDLAAFSYGRLRPIARFRYLLEHAFQLFRLSFPVFPCYSYRLFRLGEVEQDAGGRLARMCVAVFLWLVERGVHPIVAHVDRV